MMKADVVYPVSMCSVRFWIRYYGVLNRKLLSFASVLQAYAIINAILGVILSFVIASAADYVPIAGLLFSILPIGASFLIYSFGEVIKLLHEIKLNTRKTEK